MEFNKNEAAARAGSTAVESGLRAKEINLYEELISFAGLSPEEQRRLMARPKQSEEKAVKPTHADPVSTPTADNPVEAKAPEPAGEPVSDSEEPGERAEASDRSEGLFDRSGTGALLAGLSVDPDFVYTGDLSRGACFACGSESGADDLFCLGCGVFIDEIDSTPKFNPTCGECGQGIAAGEIFCPWCGAVPSA